MSKSVQLVRFDWFIKNMLRDKGSFAILEGFLTELLREEIIILDILESESNKNSKDDKFNRVDVLVKNQKGEHIIIEVQNNKELDYLQRILYGTSKNVVENIIMGQSYAEIKKVISVSVVYFDLGQGEDYIYYGATHFIGIHQKDELQLSAQQKTLFGKEKPQNILPEYYLIKTTNFDENVKDTLDEWVYFFKTGRVRDSFKAKGLKQAKKKLDFAKMSDKEQRVYKAYLESLHDEASYALTLKADTEDLLREERVKAEKVLEEEKIKAEKVLEEEKIKAENIGMEKGEYTKALKTAEKCLSKGMSIEETAELTELSVIEVTKILKNLNTKK